MRMSFFSNRLFKFLLCGLVFFFVLITIKDVYTQGPFPTYPYTLSAHGNITYGVNRTGLSSFSYSIGNCAHCHEQHASIGGAEPAPAGGSPSKYELFKPLFSAQNAAFCYGCHDDPTSATQYQFSMPNQYNYSRIAGGYTGTTPNDVKEAFQQTSSHGLATIQSFIRNQWNFDNTLGNNNPCSGCHNPHRAKRDHHSTSGTPSRTDGGNLIISSVSRPSQHNKDNNIWQLWGDGNGERMKDYTSLYCAPYRYNDSTTTREPDGCSIPANDCQTGKNSCSNGAGLFDSVSFCRDCHGIAGTGRTLINWNIDQHGNAYQVCCDFGDKKAPYSDATNYVLSCLDCHEPHGSVNSDLLREEVNGVYVGAFGNAWYNFCGACHSNLNKHMGPNITPTDTNCWGCHSHGWNVGSRCGCTSCYTF